MHPNNVPFTAVNTPFGLYKWLIMSIGLKNAPAIHQYRVTKVLHGLIGNICHIYLNDIIIWSATIKQYEKDVCAVFEALQKGCLYVNEKKTDLFQTEIKFLGLKVSAKGIEADAKKVDTILSWPVPKSAMETHSFLGLLRYIASFLSKLADYMVVLLNLVMKDTDKHFSAWTDTHQAVFNSIKKLVVIADI